MNTIKIYRTISDSFVYKHKLNFSSVLFKMCNNLFPMPEEKGSYSNHGRCWDFEGYYFDPNFGAITQEIRLKVTKKK